MRADDRVGSSSAYGAMMGAKLRTGGHVSRTVAVRRFGRTIQERIAASRIPRSTQSRSQRKTLSPPLCVPAADGVMTRLSGPCPSCRRRPADRCPQADNLFRAGGYGRPIHVHAADPCFVCVVDQCLRLGQAMSFPGNKLLIRDRGSVFPNVAAPCPRRILSAVSKSTRGPV